MAKRASDGTDNGPAEELAFRVQATEQFESARYSSRAGYWRSLLLDVRTVADGKAGYLPYNHKLSGFRMEAGQSTRDDVREPLGVRAYDGIAFTSNSHINLGAAQSMAAVLGVVDRACEKAASRQEISDWPANVAVIGKALGVAWLERPSTDKDRRWQNGEWQHAGATVLVPLAEGVNWLRGLCEDWRPAERRQVHELECPLYTCSVCGGLYEGRSFDAEPRVCRPCTLKEWEAQNAARLAAQATPAA